MPYEKWKKRTGLYWKIRKRLYARTMQKGNILNINAAGARMLGYTSEQLAGASISKFLGPNVPLQIYLDNVLTNGYTEGYFRVIGQDGEKRSLLFKKCCLPKSLASPYIIGSAIDITETIRVQKRTGKPTGLY